jgi:hypothetical protein
MTAASSSVEDVESELRGLDREDAELPPEPGCSGEAEGSRITEPC